MDKISLYLAENKITQTDFAKSVGVPAAMIYQYINGIRPVSEKVSVRIEIATGGRLSRKDLRPGDWMEIWPELAGKEVV